MSINLNFIHLGFMDLASWMVILFPKVIDTVVWIKMFNALCGRDAKVGPCEGEIKLALL